MPVIDPTTGAPFQGNVIQPTRLSKQALALLNLYPMPNFNGTGGYNYQIPTLGASHVDAMQLRMNKLIDQKNQLSGLFSFQSTRQETPNLFDFIDTTDILGFNTSVSWVRRFTPRFFSTLTIGWNRQGFTVKPFFENRENISGQAGITGNNQEPINWGPPALTFASGISTLPMSSPRSSRIRPAPSATIVLDARSAQRHVRRRFQAAAVQLLSQQNPRGTFTFTGAATGNDFADFLLGIPDTSSLAFGNADKYFRESSTTPMFTDDWRISPGLR